MRNTFLLTEHKNIEFSQVIGIRVISISQNNGFLGAKNSAETKINTSNLSIVVFWNMKGLYDLFERQVEIYVFNSVNGHFIC